MTNTAQDILFFIENNKKENEFALSYMKKSDTGIFCFEYFFPNRSFVFVINTNGDIFKRIERCRNNKKYRKENMCINYNLIEFDKNTLDFLVDNVGKNTMSLQELRLIGREIIVSGYMPPLL